MTDGEPPIHPDSPFVALAEERMGKPDLFFAIEAGDSHFSAAVARSDLKNLFAKWEDHKQWLRDHPDSIARDGENIEDAIWDFLPTRAYRLAHDVESKTDEQYQEMTVLAMALANHSLSTAPEMFGFHWGTIHAVRVRLDVQGDEIWAACDFMPIDMRDGQHRLISISLH